MDYQSLLADRTRNMGASMIRETLKVVSQPGMISLAGGLPAPESFPIKIIEKLATLVLRKYASSALQYTPSEGFPPLREALVGFLQQKGIHTTPDGIITTSGSQGTLDAVGKILITKGDKIAVEAPTYMGAISAFNPYEPQYIALETDKNGLIPESLEEILRSHRIKFIYLVPTFQNPTGRTIPLDRRKAIAEIIVEHQALLIEDDPYSALRCRGDHVPPIKTLAPDNTVYTSTFSKILSPGLRIGFCVAPDQIKRWLVLAKQGIDLHTSTFGQALAAEYLSGGYFDRYLPEIISVYRRKQEAMLTALDNHFPDDFKWSKPEGGMFIWAEGPRGLDTGKLYEKAVKRKVVFIPGKYFYTIDGDGREAMRLNYTMADEETIDRAIKILAEVIAEECDHHSSGGMNLAAVGDGSAYLALEMKSLPDNLKFEPRVE